MTIIAVFFLSSLKFWANVQFSTLFLSILPSEAMLGCTQEEIGRAGWCAVCINSWYLPAFVFLYAPPCHCQIAAIFKRFISQISLVDDEGYVDSFVNMHDFFFYVEGVTLTSVFCNFVTEASTTLSIFCFAVCTHHILSPFASGCTELTVEPLNWVHISEPTLEKVCKHSVHSVALSIQRAQDCPWCPNFCRYRV